MYAALVWQKVSCKDEVEILIGPLKMILLGKLPPEPLRFLLPGDCTAPSGPQDDDDCEDSHDDPVPVCKLLVTVKHSAGMLCFLK